MNFAIILIIVIVLLAIVSTLMLAGKSDEGYRNDTKRNATNLTVIYVIAIIISLVAVGVYIRWFA